MLREFDQGGINIPSAPTLPTGSTGAVAGRTHAHTHTRMKEKQQGTPRVRQAPYLNIVSAEHHVNRLFLRYPPARWTGRGRGRGVSCRHPITQTSCVPYNTRGGSKKACSGSSEYVTGLTSQRVTACRKVYSQVGNVSCQRASLGCAQDPYPHAFAGTLVEEDP